MRVTVNDEPLPGAFSVTITNRVEPIALHSDLFAPRTLDVVGEATFTVDPETYERLAGYPDQPYTLKIDQDCNPWHRTVTGPRGWASKIAVGVWWTFRKHVLRRRLLESTVITIPNCTLNR